MKVLLSQRELAELLGVSRKLVGRRWSGPGGTFTPDVRVANVLGWEPARVQAFGEAAGLLDADGKTLREPLELERVPDPPGDWTVPTRELLSLTDISTRWGRSLLLIIRLRDAGRLPKPLVRIGTGTHEVCGWTLDDVETYGRQLGRLDADGSWTPTRTSKTTV